jgi:hypothetical protein
MTENSNHGVRYKGFFDYHDREKEHYEMVSIIETAQKLLVLFLDVTDGCPRCVEKMKELFQ